MGIVCEPLTTSSLKKQGGAAAIGFSGDRLKNVKSVTDFAETCTPESCLTRDEESADSGELGTARIPSTTNSSASSSRGGSWSWQSNFAFRIDENQDLREQCQQQLEEIRLQRERVGNWHDLLLHTDDLSLSCEKLVDLDSAGYSSWDTTRVPKLFSPQADYDCLMQGEQEVGTFSSSDVFRASTPLDNLFLRHENLNLHRQALLLSEHQQQQQQQPFAFSDAIYPATGLFHCSSGSTGSAIAAASSHPRSTLELLLGSSSFDFRHHNDDNSNNNKQGSNNCSSWSSWNARQANAGIADDSLASKQVDFAQQVGQAQSTWPGQSSKKCGKKTEEMSSKCLLQESNRDAKRLKGSLSTQRTKFGTGSKKNGSHKREPALNTNLKPRAKQGCANDPQSLAARQRRERISDRLKILQELIPNGSKVDLVTMLEKAINYVKFLQLQVKVLMNDEYWPKREEDEEQNDQQAAVNHQSGD